MQYLLLRNIYIIHGMCVEIAVSVLVYQLTEIDIGTTQLLGKMVSYQYFLLLNVHGWDTIQVMNSNKNVIGGGFVF